MGSKRRAEGAKDTQWNLCLSVKLTVFPCIFCFLFFPFALNIGQESDGTWSITERPGPPFERSIGHTLDVDEILLSRKMISSCGSDVHAHMVARAGP